MSMYQPVAADKQDTLSSPLVEGPFEPIDPADTTPGDQVVAVTPVLVIARDEPRGDKGDELSDEVAEEKQAIADDENLLAGRDERNEELSQQARNRAAAQTAERIGLDPHAGAENPDVRTDSDVAAAPEDEFSEPTGDGTVV